MWTLLLWIVVGLACFAVLGFGLVMAVAPTLFGDHDRCE